MASTVSCVNDFYWCENCFKVWVEIGTAHTKTNYERIYLYLYVFLRGDVDCKSNVTTDIDVKKLIIYITCGYSHHVRCCSFFLVQK